MRSTKKFANLSIALQKYRLKDSFGMEPVTGLQAARLQTPLAASGSETSVSGTPDATGTVALQSIYRIIGEPEDIDGARQLASEDRYQFQRWALSLFKRLRRGFLHLFVQNVFIKSLRIT